MTSNDAAIRDSLQLVANGLETVLLGINALISSLDSEKDESGLDFDPMDPRNKQDIGGVEKLSDRGIEVCYRLFDSGKTRYAVSTLMGISFGAANHRYQAWQKAGGIKRERKPL